MPKSNFKYCKATVCNSFWPAIMFCTMWCFSILVWQFSTQSLLETTRTTRTPAFWGYPPPPHDYPYYWFILNPKSKQDKVKITIWRICPNFKLFNFDKKTLHTTQLLKLLDKMCKYIMDPAGSIIYLHILSNNFRTCVVCKVFVSNIFILCKIQRNVILG